MLLQVPVESLQQEECMAAIMELLPPRKELNFDFSNSIYRSSAETHKSYLGPMSGMFDK